MGERPISVALDRATQPRDGFLVGAKVQFGGARGQPPMKGEVVPRRKAERLFDMRLGFIRAAAENLAQAHRCVSPGHVWIERQRPLTFRDALDRAIAVDLNETEPVMRQALFGASDNTLVRIGSAAA
jgi:hypothetical protein